MILAPFAILMAVQAVAYFLRKERKWDLVDSAVMLAIALGALWRWSVR